MTNDLLKVEIINKSQNETPKYSTDGAAGMDLRANEEVTLEPFARAVVGTGLYTDIPVGVEGQVRPRSGMAIKKGLTVLNAPGTIDSDYRGEIGVILINLSNETVVVEVGERVAQIVFAKHEKVELVGVEELSSTDRGAGGFGSTGTK